MSNSPDKRSHKLCDGIEPGDVGIMSSPGKRTKKASSVQYDPSSPKTPRQNGGIPISTPKSFQFDETLGLDSNGSNHVPFVTRTREAPTSRDWIENGQFPCVGNLDITNIMSPSPAPRRILKCGNFGANGIAESGGILPNFHQDRGCSLIGEDALYGPIDYHQVEINDNNIVHNEVHKSNRLALDNCLRQNSASAKASINGITTSPLTTNNINSTSRPKSAGSAASSSAVAGVTAARIVPKLELSTVSVPVQRQVSDQHFKSKSTNTDTETGSPGFSEETYDQMATGLAYISEAAKIVPSPPSAAETSRVVTESLPGSRATHAASASGGGGSGGRIKQARQLAALSPPSVPAAITHNQTRQKSLSEESLDPAVASGIVCNCKKTKCLKLYCDCFKNRKFCSSNCRCSDCSNNAHGGSEREIAIASITERNPEAFKPRLISDAKSMHQGTAQGCHCKKSSCLKKYCECFTAKVSCGARCRCHECKNMSTASPEPEPSRRSSSNNNSNNYNSNNNCHNSGNSNAFGYENSQSNTIIINSRSSSISASRALAPLLTSSQDEDKDSLPAFSRRNSRDQDSRPSGLSDSVLGSGGMTTKMLHEITDTTNRMHMHSSTHSRHSGSNNNQSFMRDNNDDDNDYSSSQISLDRLSSCRDDESYVDDVHGVRSLSGFSRFTGLPDGGGGGGGELSPQRLLLEHDHDQGMQSPLLDLAGVCEQREVTESLLSLSPKLLALHEIDFVDTMAPLPRPSHLSASSSSPSSVLCLTAAAEALGDGVAISGSRLEASNSTNNSRRRNHVVVNHRQMFPKK